MKRSIKIITAGLSVLLVLTVSLRALPVHATYNNNLIMDDTVFDKTSSMTAAGIDSWLNSTWPNSCISTNNGFSAPDPTGYSYSTGFTYGGNVSAGTVIAHAAYAYGINPQVILATLEKESSVVSGAASYHCQYINTAMGYDCKDNAACPANPDTESGFSKQIIHAAWMLRFHEQRSEGNVGWQETKPGWDNSDDPERCYSGRMTQGTYQICPSGPSAPYDGWYTIDNTAVHLDTGATAALYDYTPHFPGNQNFVDIFTAWFGGTVSAAYYSCHNGSNISGANSGAKVIPNKFDPGQPDHLALTLLNNTGSQCAEIHTWNYGYQNWLTNVATNLPAINPTDGEIISGNTYYDGRDELMLVRYNNTGSGKIEVHTWNPGYQSWMTNIATNLSTGDAANGKVVAADTNNDGRDELIFVKSANTGSGKIEVHIWNPGYQSFQNDYATNLSTGDAGNGTIIAGNVNGQDRLMFIKTSNTASGKIEVHIWNPGYQSFQNDYATNLSTGDAGNGTVVAIDNRLAFVKTSNTASGKIEVHIWNPGYQSFQNDYATNLSAL